jgi:hypothetical protein
MLVLIEPKERKGEARDYWLRPSEWLELRAEAPAADYHFHIKEIPEGVLVGYLGDMGLITVWGDGQERNDGHQRPPDWPESLLAEVRRLEEQATAEARLYRLSFNPERSWFTGRLPVGQQALGLPGDERVFLQLFDARGEPGDEREVSLPGWECEFDGSWVNEQDLFDRLGRAIGFVPCPIDVRRFSFCPDDVYLPPLSVEALPKVSSDQLQSWRLHGYGRHWLDSLDNVLKLRAWLTEGRYVLHFGNNYWVNRDGEVTSS